LVAACDKPNTFQFLMPPGTPIAQQIEAIAMRICGAAYMDLESQARKDHGRIEKLELGTAPV
jgi:formyltetrahydrofolate synthetase